VPIVNFKTPYVPLLYNIDIKSYLWPWTEEGWGQIQGYIIRVYLLSDDVVGFYSYRPASHCISEPHKGEIHTDRITVSKLCVHPDFRNLRIGSQLHDDLIRIAKKYSKKVVRMMLHEENEYRDFLIKRDWRAILISKGLFPDGRDGYLFQKEIK